MSPNWCSSMVKTAKENDNPWRTIDYQHLNSQCKWEIHQTGSPFQLALQVPPRTKKNSPRCCRWVPLNYRWNLTGKICFTRSPIPNEG